MKKNPKDHYKAITLRSGKALEDPKPCEAKAKKKEDEVVDESPKVASNPNTISCLDNLPIVTPPLPFPQLFQKKKFDAQFSKFLEIFKKLHINIPFADALKQMRTM